MGAPAGDVSSELLQNQDRALAAPKGDGVGDCGAGTGYRGCHAIDRLIADQVADIGNDPRRARLDELVIVELVQIVLHGRDLLGDHRQERLQGTERRLRRGLGQLRVSQPVQRRQQTEEFFAVKAHDIVPNTTTPGRGSITRISAGCGRLCVFGTGK